MRSRIHILTLRPAQSLTLQLLRSLLLGLLLRPAR